MDQSVSYISKEELIQLIHGLKTEKVGLVCTSKRRYRVRPLISWWKSLLYDLGMCLLPTPIVGNSFQLVLQINEELPFDQYDGEFKDQRS